MLATLLSCALLAMKRSALIASVWWATGLGEFWTLKKQEAKAVLKEWGGGDRDKGNLTSKITVKHGISSIYNTQVTWLFKFCNLIVELSKYSQKSMHGLFCFKCIHRGYDFQMEPKEGGHSNLTENQWDLDT